MNKDVNEKDKNYKDKIKTYTDNKRYAKQFKTYIKGQLV